jgi:recombination protein RecA
LGQGRDNAKAFLVEHPAIASEIEDRLRVELGLKAAPAGGESADEDEGEEAEE